MKIAVLEWICGGGMLATDASQIPDSLRAEGWTMLSRLIEEFEQAGHAVTTALDLRLVDQTCTATDARLVDGDQTDEEQTDEEQTDADQPDGDRIDGDGRMAGNALPAAWLPIAKECDLTIVVAPEFDGILQTVLRSLSAAGAALLNCSGPFLDHACDKLMTAECLARAAVAHPPTIRLGDLSPAWLNQHAPSPRNDGEPSRWIVKPRDGAGCVELSVCTSDELQTRWVEARGASSASNFVVQPLLVGEAYSCSAVVDRSGQPHWLPLVTQDFTPQLTYRGGRIAQAAIQELRPLQLLDRTLAALGPGALGWVGVDLHFLTAEQQWVVMEVNPRCTTSLVGLSRAYSSVPALAQSPDRGSRRGRGGIGRALLEAYGGQFAGFQARAFDLLDWRL